MQARLPFKETQDIPEAHLYALRVCNSGGAWAFKRAFYRLKNKILVEHGHFADYDLQHIKKKCHSCKGTGMYYSVRCNRCRNGIYDTKDVVLKRFLINGAVFHEPVGELVGNRLKIFDGYETDEDYYDHAKFRYENFDGKIVSTIIGLIEHKPFKLHPVWAYRYLLWHYDRAGFETALLNDVKMFQTNTQHRFKILLRKYNPLKAYALFFEVKKPELEPIDDLPF